MIGANTLKPGSFQHHLVVRNHKQAQFKKTLLVSLSLTAMVDMFAVLVIFLLQSFSADPLVVMKGVQLPAAISSSEIKNTPVLAIAEGKLFLDQELVGGLKEVLGRPNELMAKLKRLRESWQKTYPDKDFPGELNLQADKSISSVLVGQIMGLVSQAHYYSIQLSIVAKGNQ